MTLSEIRMSIKALLVILGTATVYAEPVVLPQGALGKLSSDKYVVREKAFSELHQWAVQNVEASPELLHRAWLASEDPEVKTRCFTLLKEVAIQREFGKGKGFVGIQMEEFMAPGQPGKPARPGVKISFVLPDTPAAKAGLRVGDVVLGVDELDFAKAAPVGKIGEARGLGGAIVAGTVLKFSDYIQSKEPDDVITLHLMRAGKMRDEKVTLMKRPASANVDAFGRFQQDESKQEADRYFKKWLKEKEEKGEKGN